MSDIYAEIEREWRATFGKTHHDLSSIRKFGDLCSEQEIRNRGKALDGLQPWLGILEFGIEWLANVHVALYLNDESSYEDARRRVAWGLIGSAVSFGLSLRTLCLSGFDTPARALLRSYIETLLPCLAALHDKSLAQAFQDADDDTKVKKFWHATASPKNLHSRIIKIERSLGLDDEVVGAMTDFRRQEYEILSQAAHLSYVAAVFTVMAPALGDDERVRPAILGPATGLSMRTIRYAAFTTWYFSRLGYNVLLGRDPLECLLTFQSEDADHRRIAAGWDVLSRITAAHWNDLPP